MRELTKKGTALMYAADDKAQVVYCKYPEESRWRVSAFSYEDLKTYAFVEVNTSLENE